MNEKITVLIVDDERFSREELNFLLESYERIDVIGEAASGEEAVMQSLKLQPDVLFLDVEMPKMDGMGVAKAVQELKKVPEIVFATAYPDFAVEAFRHQAIDYLLKPFDEEQLSETIERIEKKFQQGEKKAEFHPSKLAVEVEDTIEYLNPSDIMYVYREDRITKIVGRERMYETKDALKDVEQRLQGFSFFRIHKSYLVNLDYIYRLTPWFNGAYQLELQGTNEKLSVSRNYVKDLRNKLEL
ncbi:two component transcriptional regulator, LytTR family [Halobacillus karajensis]|uniref:Sensory transduction protein LytR n=1 Tax=Halobacillus karajensis TaxID=195088 RepID=A0A024PAM0_9BACI|nr:LytTR family DNA-binding domain-containing protein [Halobacillus karajensis]CDQ21548.1 Sensory transduction protein LytR [Halobacillus karajensis]CDQ25482.1 Sensory transduction protein LytR [Halobacillus karajensis]CDQ28987.1 Sensory transduction protein LytR [Halobacillus karajensis]SEI09094.1 two component transcriptional regulator, LytTR family [Halobacillus karajensis]